MRATKTRGLAGMGWALTWAWALVLGASGCSVGTSVVGGPGDADTGRDAAADVARNDATQDAAMDAAMDATDAPDAPSPDVVSGCVTDNDCRGNEFGFGMCDVVNHRCVQCVPGNDTCPTGQYCDPATNMCARGCRTDDACGGGSADGGVVMSTSTPACNPATHTCVGCVRDDQCPSGMLCMGEVCVVGCSASSRCPDGQMCCSGGCIDTAVNVAHCGMCGNRCAVTHGEAACVMGHCTVGNCSGSYRDCDTMSANGCEADTTTDLMNCGGCGRICPTPAHASPTCTSGRCGFTCAAGFADCNMDPADGCEVDLSAAPADCGRCGNQCMTANGTSSCVMGRCAVGSCRDGFGDCNMDVADGCETNLGVSAAHCGVCGRACMAPASGSAACVDGRCVVGACADGHADCDGDPSNGCEVDTTTSATHCGMCGHACMLANGTASCAMGRCTVATCNAGFADCNMDPADGCEVNTNSAAANCGACGNRCMLAHATAACAMGRCAVASCDEGYADCNMDPADGCETNLGVDARNCGECGRACASTSGSSVCVAGRCGVGTCAAGFADCDGDPTNGCETNVLTNRDHCGGCGRVCAVSNASAVCVAGACGVGVCNPGFADCNMRATDGCEVAVVTDINNCGRCGNVCPTVGGSTAVCRAGVCAVGTCPAGREDCDGNPANGCETDVLTGTANCGRCGNVCPALANASTVCRMGVCGLGTCNAGFGDCDNNAANGCETNLTTTVTACGACGRACSLPNATPSCTAGVCGVLRCNTGFANCDGDASNGCETNLNTTEASCGACGNRCVAPAGGSVACVSGACVQSCASGQTNCSGTCQPTGATCSSAGTGGCAQSGTVVCSGTGTTCNATPRTSGSCTSPAGGVCGAGGACACASGQTNCSGTCRTTGSDPSNCGGCGVVCVAPAGGSVSCVGGGCVQACPAGQTNCAGTCRVTGTSCTSAGTGGCAQTGTLVCSGSSTACSAGPRTSGACTTPSGGTCNGSGTCACAGGLTECSGACVDVNSSAANCGVCGRACGAGQACAAGVCVGTGELRFTLTWNRPGDMDLHVTPPCGTLIYWAGRSACGGTLDRDDITGTGPENIFWTSGTAHGTYTVCVAPYSISGATNWTLQIFNGSTLTRTYTGTLSSSLGNGCGFSATYVY